MVPPDWIAMPESRVSVLNACITLEDEIDAMMMQRDNLLTQAESGDYPPVLMESMRRRADQINRNVCEAQMALWTMMIERDITPTELTCTHPDVWSTDEDDAPDVPAGTYCWSCGDKVEDENYDSLIEEAEREGYLTAEQTDAILASIQPLAQWEIDLLNELEVVG